MQVALRIRPINDTELDEGAAVIAHKVGDQMVVLMDPDEDPDDALRSNRSREKTFIFDIVFDQQASQEEVYCSTTQHLVEGVISGYNATVFAYGPSGAGKTYTMLGMDSEPGIYLQTLNDLFQAIEETSDDMEYTVSMSYLEIYNEVIRDLLNPSSEFLELREDSKGSIQIAGITEVSTTNAQEAGLEQRLANAKKKASQMEKLLPKQIINKDQREVLRLLCKAHELEVENTELQANNLYQKNLLCQKDFVIQRYHQHRLLCEEIIQQQRELIKGNWIPVPEPLEKRYRLYSQELEEGTLNRLLLLHSVMFNSFRDGSVLNIAQQMEVHKEDTSRDQLDNRKDLPWGAKFELPPIVIEPDSEGYKSSKVTPSKKPGKRDSLLTPTSFRLLITPPVHEKSNSLSMKKMVSKLCSPTSLDLNMRKLSEDVPTTSLSAEALKEIAVSTKSISLIAASRRYKTHDQEGGNSFSTRHSLDDGASEPKYWKPNITPDLTESQRKVQADRKQLHSSPRRGRQRNSSLDRRARKKRSPSSIRNAQMTTEKLPIPMIDHPSENQSPQSHPMQHSKATKTLFPAVPVATKAKFPTTYHTDENTLQIPEISFTFPSAIWQCNPGQNRGPVIPREVKGSADSSTGYHNSLHPGINRKQLGGSGKKQGRIK
ncbi:uncharacterized protein LOC141498842 [Macrotis lagotis]|uniref:uncharacterized protein LOC141498842 n=1 Tax=Macrotis lagotis TaxID=92651 RepID=UPI003D699E7F